MHLFSEETFTLKSLRKLAGREGDPVVFEKALRALTLVAALREAGLDFVFKGGTSLMLHLDPPRRLSIDVDIACNEPIERVLAALKEVCDANVFIDHAHQTGRDGENPPMKYFRVFHSSTVTPAGQSAAIQLDVLISPAPYARIVEKPVRLRQVPALREVLVRVPSIECLLGDKLTAFAPVTIGIRYEPVTRRTGEPAEPQPIRVAKQLFDIGELFLHAQDIGMVADTWHAHFAEQNRWRFDGALSPDNVLDDTLDAVYTLSQIDFSPKEESAKTAFFRTGIKALNTHLIGGRFTLTDAKTAASRAALLAVLIRTGKRTDDLAALRAGLAEANPRTAPRITGPWAKLDTLRKTNPEAFYYWSLASRFSSGG